MPRRLSKRNSCEMQISVSGNGTAPAVLLRCRVKTIWSPASETSAALIHSLHFTFIFHRADHHARPWHHRQDFCPGLIPTRWEMSFPCSPSCFLCNFDQALMWLGSDPDMTGPGTQKKRVCVSACLHTQCVGTCVCVCVGGGERGGEEAPAETPDLTSKPEEERNYSEGVFPLLLPLPCG